MHSALLSALWVIAFGVSVFPSEGYEVLSPSIRHGPPLSLEVRVLCWILFAVLITCAAIVASVLGALVSRLHKVRGNIKSNIGVVTVRSFVVAAGTFVVELCCDQCLSRIPFLRANSFLLLITTTLSIRSAKLSSPKASFTQRRCRLSPEASCTPF